MLEFSVTNWTAWAPGLESPESWIKWSLDPLYSDAKASAYPKLSKVSPMLRRRLDLSGKMAISTLMDCIDNDREIPIVFCSRHGEVARSATMLASMAAGEPVSPTSFSLSVHNAVSGLFSIIRSDQANYITILARKNLMESGIVEASGLLDSGHDKVYLVVSNNVLPECFNDYQDREEVPFAFAWMLSKDGKEKISLSHSSSCEAPAFQLPQELEVFRFFLSGRKELRIPSDDHSWIWSRNV